MYKRQALTREFFLQDVLTVAPKLLGKTLCIKDAHGQVNKGIITETEAYRGEEDLACHARFGKTKRTEPMYMAGGTVYVYLIYGIYNLLNIVTGKENEPQAVLIRGIEGLNKPGLLTKKLGIDRGFNKLDVCIGQNIWIEDGADFAYTVHKRIGVGYAGEWAEKPWRFLAGAVSKP